MWARVWAAYEVAECCPTRSDRLVVQLSAVNCAPLHHSYIHTLCVIFDILEIVYIRWLKYPPVTFTAVVTEYATFSKIHCIYRRVASMVVLICTFLMHCVGLWRCHQQWQIVTWCSTSPRGRMRTQIQPPSSTGMPHTLLVLRVGVLSGVCTKWKITSQ